LYLRSRSEVLIVSCDVCLLAPQQTDTLRRRISQATGVPREQVLVGCIHTHSGPDTGLGALLAGHSPPAHMDPLFERIVDAARRARAAAQPARLGVGRGEAHIGRNRRRSEGPVDPEVLVVRVDRADGRCLAVLFVHGCHPTALGHENLAYSADWPWAACARIEAALPGATALFALGAHADVDPRTRELLDLAIPDQSLGVGFDEVERLGDEVGRTVAETAASLATSAGITVGAASSRIPIPVHGADRGEAEREAQLDSLRGEALAALDLPRDSRVGTGDLFRLESERTQHHPLAERRERIARVRRYLRDRTAPRFAFARVPAVEAQVIRLGEAVLLGLPAEPTVDVGLDWKRRMGAAPAAVLGIANGWLRYLPHPDNFFEPEAHLHYEILLSTLVPQAALQLLDEGQRLAQEVQP
jgi:hypothetical protein